MTSCKHANEVSGAAGEEKKAIVEARSHQRIGDIGPRKGGRLDEWIEVGKGAGRKGGKEAGRKEGRIGGGIDGWTEGDGRFNKRRKVASTE